MSENKLTKGIEIKLGLDADEAIRQLRQVEHLLKEIHEINKSSPYFCISSDTHSQQLNEIANKAIKNALDSLYAKVETPPRGMTLCEAVREMKAQGKKYITKSEFMGFSFVYKIEPTDDPECCIVHCSNENELWKCWQPKLCDLLSTDWVVCDE